jgi:signal transduction histidine kinase
LRQVDKIASTISRKYLGATAFILIFQIFVMSIFFVIVAYKNAHSRGNFLATSNNSALGLMLTTGDIFQIRNLSKSFLNEATASIQIKNNLGEVVYEAGESSSDFSHFMGKIHSHEGSLFLATVNQVKYNDQVVGELKAVNKMLFGEWLSILSAMLILNILGFLVHGRVLHKFLIFVGTQFEHIEGIFRLTNNGSDLDKVYGSRLNTGIYEVESLAHTVKTLVENLLRVAEIEKDAAIGRITASLTHDLRAPLGVIERMLVLDEPIHTVRRSVRDALNRLYAMIDSLRRSETDALVHRSLTILDFSFGAELLKNRVEMCNIEFVVPADSLQVVVDAMKVERAWINLASNAIEAAESQVVIEVLNGENGDLKILVKDDGPGIPDEFLPRLFQRGATYGKNDGTGLGLAYVRQIMRGHGGDVTYRREDDMTVFECYLPNAMAKVVKDDHHLIQSHQEVTNHSDPIRSTAKQVSICFISPELNKRVFDRLAGISQDSYNFVLGISQESTIVLTDSEEVANQLPDRNVRPILMSLLSDDEVVRRAPIRLGIKG